MVDWLGLTDKVCIVTGALGGLGRAITQAYLEAGARVCMLDLPPADPDAALADFAGHAGRVAFVGTDVGQEASVRAAFQACCDQLGAPQVLVNNAAMSAPSPLGKLDFAVWQKQMAVNVGGYLLCAQAFHAARDAGQPGAIVNISSIASRNAQPNSGGYAIGKAAILMLTQQLAVEWGPEGIRVNNVSPGLFRTPLTERFYQDPADRARREAVVPLRRIGVARELADAVVYLGSARASYVNGAEIIVDGGFSQTLMSHIPRPYAAS